MRRMITSTFVCVVSVNSRNLTPVNVLKHCNLKFSDSRTSSPEGGSGRVRICPPPGMPGLDRGRSEVVDLMGLRRAVIAWTLFRESC